MTDYSNPRTFAVIENWPSGSRRVKATFYIETTPKGERAIRVTTGDPIKLTYARRMRIVDGDDGRTYIARDHGHGMASIFRGDMKYQHEIAHEPGVRYNELMQLFITEPAVKTPGQQPDGEWRDNLGESPDY